jgi:2-polyprenyl-3-methyl-5-hydroxy-6-metoxy-1,4-benzoquinol methylase
MPAADREKWNAKYAAGETPDQPSAVLLSLAKWLPSTGRALDIAAGAGRHAVWLAAQGLEVTAADIAGVGLQLAQSRAHERGLSVRVLETDLEQVDFPPGPWDAIVSVCYLWRPLFAAYPRHIAPGGRLFVVQPTTLNLQRHARPPRPYLLEPGELRELLAGWRLLHNAEDWSADGRHDAVAVAERASPA